MKYERISPTAETMAFIRGELDIPYARTISERCWAREATVDFYHREDFDIELERMKKLSSWMRIRSNSILKTIRQSGIKNIIEIGSGFSPTGLILSEDPTMSYLETDLPDVIARKERIARAIAPNRKNLNFLAVNVLDRKSLFCAATNFSGEILVMNEGLFQYFTHEEKLATAKNIHAVLKSSGGIWITTDIVLRSHFATAFNESAYGQKMRKILAENITRDMVDLAFNTYKEADDLISGAGFKIEKHCQLKLLPEMLSTSEINKHKNLEHQQLWIMRCK